MFRIQTLRSGAKALAYWSGMAGRRSAADGARIVCFHGTPHNRAAELERQLRYLRRRFEVVALAELLHRVESDPESSGALLAITFDDGLRNNVTVAYPILRRLQLPATFYLCPGLIERGSWLWNCEARQRLRHATPDVRQALSERHGLETGVERFIDWMKTLDMARREQVEADIRAATPRYVPSPRERHELDLAGWHELRPLDPGLIAFGSHTLHHPILTCLTPEEVQPELRDSRRLIEERLQRPAETLAYPNGDHNALVREIARQHYRAAVAEGDEVVSPIAARHAVPRFTAPAGVLRLALAANRPRKPEARAADALRLVRPAVA